MKIFTIIVLIINIISGIMSFIIFNIYGEMQDLIPVIVNFSVSILLVISYNLFYKENKGTK